MNRVEKILTSAFCAGAVAAIVWMSVRLVNAVIVLVTPIPSNGYPNEVIRSANAALDAAIPIFLLDNGAVAISDATGFLATTGGPGVEAAGNLAASSEATLCVTVIAVLLAVGFLCFRLLRAKPFTRGMARWMGAAGGILVVGAALAQLFAWLSRLEMISALAPTIESNGWRTPTSAIEIDIVPFACGAMLLIVAMALQLGSMLQRDTEGLV